MNQIDNIMALADVYATQRQHAHYQHETDARQALRAALAEQPTEREPVRTEFNRVINHAIEQGFEASTFLRCWREGDWSSCKEFGFDPNTEAYTAPQPAKAADKPCERVQLTDDEIDVLWAKQQTKPFKTHAEDRMAFARAIIAAYGAKCVPLTEEEISALWLDSISGPLTAAKFARAVERAHGITGETK